MAKAKLTAREVEVIHRLGSLQKLSQSELASAFGVDRGQISRILNGKSWAATSSLPRALERIYRGISD